MIQSGSNVRKNRNQGCLDAEPINSVHLNKKAVVSNSLQRQLTKVGQAISQTASCELRFSIRIPLPSIQCINSLKLENPQWQIKIRLRV